MEKKNSDSKRKLLPKSHEEPPDKKMRHDVSIEDILAPSEERNKDLSDHSIQQVVGSCSSSKVDIPQNNDDNAATTSDNLTNNTSNHENQSDAKEIPKDSSDPADKSTTSPSPHSSVEEITGIRLSKVISPEKSSIEESINKDDKVGGKKLAWKCDKHFSDYGTQSCTETTTDTVSKTEDPQTSTSSFTPLRNRCAYGSKCYRKSSGHKAKYSHPGDSDYDIKDDRPECRYGIKCYRKDPKHKQDFKHTMVRRKRAQTPVRVSTPGTYKSCTDYSSFEESVDESEYDPSDWGDSTDTYDDDDDDNGDWCK